MLERSVQVRCSTARPSPKPWMGIGAGTPGRRVPLSPPAPRPVRLLLFPKKRGWLGLVGRVEAGELAGP